MGLWNPFAPTGFIRRNKRRLAIGAVVLVSVGTAALYLYRKYDEARTASERKQLFRAKLHSQYEHNRRTADLALRSQLTQLKFQICKELDVEATTMRLKDKGPLSSDEKKKLWEQIKIHSFTRTLTSVYSLCLMNLLINVQLSIIGRYLFAKFMENEEASTDASTASSNPNATTTLSNQVQQTFLSYVLYMQTKGLQMMLPQVQNAVEQHISSLSLRDFVNVDDLNKVISKIRQTFEASFIGTSANRTGSLDNDEQPDQGLSAGIAEVLLPPEGHDEEFFKTDSNESLKLMVDELRDLIDSVEFQAVYTEMLDQAFAVLSKHIAKFFVKKQNAGSKSNDKQESAREDLSVSASSSSTSTLTSSKPESTVQNQPVTQLPVANLLPYVTKEVKNVFSLKENEKTGLSENEYLKRMQHVERLNVFCAMIYSMNLPL